MTNRMYPSYTTANLRNMLDNVDGETRAKMEAEIAARESGASLVKVTPQIDGGMVQAKVGRL